MAASGPFSRDPEQANDLYKKAKAAMLDNNYQMVFELCKKGLLFDDKNAYFWFGLGRCYFSRGNNKDAFEFFYTATKLANQRNLNGADWEILKYLGLCYFEGKWVKPNDVEAKKCFDGAIQLANIYLTTLFSPNDLCERLIVEEEILSLQIYAHDASGVTRNSSLLFGYNSHKPSDNHFEKQGPATSAPTDESKRLRKR